MQDSFPLCSKVFGKSTERLCSGVELRLVELETLSVVGVTLEVPTVVGILFQVVELVRELDDIVGDSFADSK